MTRPPNPHSERADRDERQREAIADEWDHGDLDSEFADWMRDAARKTAWIRNAITEFLDIILDQRSRRC